MSRGLKPLLECIWSRRGGSQKLKEQLLSPCYKWASEPQRNEPVRVAEDFYSRYKNLTVKF